jgi:hypothetical protein
MVSDQHAIRIRDLRLRIGAPDVYAAHCSCGWMGDERRGRAGMRAAVKDGRAHLAESGARPRDPRVPIRDEASRPD